MKSTKVTAVRAVVLSLLIAVLVGVGLLSTRKTRTDTVAVTAIDEGYVVEITSAGRWLLPMSPEGPFPEWHEQTRFLALGDGERTDLEGRTYKKYTLGKDLEWTGLSGMFSNCTLYISEEDQRLIVQGDLSAEQRGRINHSGAYDGIRVAHPNVIPLSAGATIESIDHRYIRTKARVQDGEFEAAKIRFSTALWKEGEFEIVGLVRRCPGDRHSLVLCSYKELTRPRDGRRATP